MSEGSRTTAQSVRAASLLTGDGRTIPNGSGTPVRYRFVRPTDDVGAVTELLHRAYAPLAAKGLRYVAAHQSVDVTRRRMAKGDTVVALIDERIVAVVTLARASATSGSPFYDRPDVASFGQFAVEPVHQKHGIGSVLLATVETLARQRAVSVLALDTSELAVALIEFYTKKGYAFVEHVRWPDVNYRSVILAKQLSEMEQAGSATAESKGMSTALAQVRNVRIIDETLYTSGQPNEEQLAAARAAGIDVVINLALHDDPRYSLPDERGCVETLGMTYVHIPVRFDAPTETDLLAFFDAVEANRGRSMLVHCAANFRVAAFLGLYDIIRRHRSRAEAFALLDSVWQPNDVWQRFIDETLRKYGA